MGGREVFTRPFAAALHQACTGRGLTQKQIGELIAQRQHQHRRRGPEREAAIATAKTQWPGRLSAWKKGDRLPATLEELFLALDVMASDTPRTQWEQWWRQARDPAPADPGPMAVSLPARPLDLSLVPAWPSDNSGNTQEAGQENPLPGAPDVGSTLESAGSRAAFQWRPPRSWAERNRWPWPRAVIAITCVMAVVIAGVILKVTQRQDTAPPTTASPSPTSTGRHRPPGLTPPHTIKECQASMEGLELTSPSCPSATIGPPYGTPGDGADARNKGRIWLSEVSGKVSGLKNGEKVWLLLWAPKATENGEFFIVSENGVPATGVNGAWRQRIGIKIDEYGGFHLYAVIVDDSFSTALEVSIR